MTFSASSLENGAAFPLQCACSICCMLRNRPKRNAAKLRGYPQQSWGPSATRYWSAIIAWIRCRWTIHKFLKRAGTA